MRSTTASASWLARWCWRPAHHAARQRFHLPLSARSRSFLIDGEAIVTNGDGLAVFDLIRRKRHGGDAVLIAFDLIELDGEDLRRSPIEHRKRKLAKLARSPHPGIVLNEFFEGDGDILFEHACKLGCEVSYRNGSAHLIARGDLRIGSKSKIRMRQQ